MFIVLREIGKGRKREEEREIDVCVGGNINQLCLLHTPTRDLTCKLLVYGTLLQPTEPHEQSSLGDFHVYSLKNP